MILKNVKINKFFIVLSMLVVAFGSALLMLVNTGYRFNYSHSAPIGVWKVNLYDKNLKIGNFMEICPPDTSIVKLFLKKGYLKNGSCPSGSIPFLKPLVALPGDTIEVSLSGVKINGKLLNSTGVKIGMPITEGTFIVKNDEAWFISNFDPSSFDSRYFGPISYKDIIGTAQPVFIFKNKRAN